MHRTLAALTVVTVSLVGCTRGDTGAGGAVQSPEPPSISTAPAEPAPSEPAPAEEPCGEAELAAIDEAIAGQLDAFAAGDFDRALTFSSEGFRGQFDPESFEDVIRQGFPVAARNATHRTRRCATVGNEEGTAAQALVSVEANDGETLDLIYLLLVEGDRWVIGGATPVVPADEASDAVVA